MIAQCLMNERRLVCWILDLRLVFFGGSSLGILACLKCRNPLLGGGNLRFNTIKLADTMERH